MRKIYLLLASTCCLIAAPVNADIAIGNGFSCDGNAILKGTKEVKYTKARSTLTQTIEKLKKKLETAPKKKKASIKAQLAEARATKTQLLACSKGTLDPSEVDPIFTQLASGSGIYNGTYSGVVGGFLPITGNIQAAFALDGTVFGLTLSLGGNLGSALDAKPLVFQGEVGGVGFPAQFFLTNTFLGDVTLSVTQAGHLTITNGNSPKGTVNFEGDFLQSTITSTLGGSYDGVSFNGGATLTRAP